MHWRKPRSQPSKAAAPFARFRRVLDRHRDHVDEWLAFRDERRLGRAREWLADAGYGAVPLPPGVTSA